MLSFQVFKLFFKFLFCISHEVLIILLLAFAIRIIGSKSKTGVS